MSRGFSLGASPIRSSKKLKLLAAAAVFAGLAWSWNWYNQQPVVGVITSTIKDSGEVKAESTQSPGRYRSENISFAYPATYSDNLNTAPSGKIIEQYSMTAHLAKTESRRISIMVKSAGLPSDIKEDSAHQFRVNQIDDYVLSQETAASGMQVDKFVKNDGGEVTYFINGDGKYAIISSTSNIANGGYLADVKSVIDSFVWN